MEIPRDFPRTLSRQKNGSKISICELSPPWKFLKVDRYGPADLTIQSESVMTTDKEVQTVENASGVVLTMPNQFENIQFKFCHRWFR